MAPNLHWPDTMFSFDHATGMLFTCDAFGLHYCTADPYDSGALRTVGGWSDGSLCVDGVCGQAGALLSLHPPWLGEDRRPSRDSPPPPPSCPCSLVIELGPLESHYRFYYDCLMHPNAKSVSTALRKIQHLTVAAVANGHGPMLRYNTAELMGRYGRWAAAAAAAPASCAVLYAADYGFSDRLAQTLARGVTKAGAVAVEMVDLLSADPQVDGCAECGCWCGCVCIGVMVLRDVEKQCSMHCPLLTALNYLPSPPQELVEVLGRTQGVVVMTPPGDSEEARAALSTLLSAIKPTQRVVVAESYGGRDEPVDSLVRALVSVGVEPLLEPLRVKADPTEALYQVGVGLV